MHTTVWLCRESMLHLSTDKIITWALNMHQMIVFLLANDCPWLVMRIIGAVDRLSVLLQTHCSGFTIYIMLSPWHFYPFFYVWSKNLLIIRIRTHTYKNTHKYYSSGKVGQPFQLTRYCETYVWRSMPDFLFLLHVFIG